MGCLQDDEVGGEGGGRWQWSGMNGQFSNLKKKYSSLSAGAAGVDRHIRQGDSTGT